MQKKYQVFISSTYEDLKEERKNVIETLLMMDCIPSGMEVFCAADEEQFEYIKKVIDLCDYYILIIGKRYGSISPITGKSYTEMEYDYAKQKGIPILVFPVYAKVNKPEDDNQELLEKFKKKAYEKKMGGYWGNPDELGKKVAVSLEKTIKQFDMPGWIRGGQTETVAEVNVTEAKGEILVFADEKVTITYRDIMLSDLFSDHKKETTWGKLFVNISPMLAESVTSSQVANRILRFVTTENPLECELLNSFENIFLNRLVNLGYVSKTEKRNKTCYILTAKGMATMNRMLEESN